MCVCVCSYNREEVQKQQQQPADVLYYSLKKGNVVPEITHNPWSLMCHQQHLQRMKENSKHRNQYSILSLQTRLCNPGLCVLTVWKASDQHGSPVEKMNGQLFKAGCLNKLRIKVIDIRYQDGQGYKVCCC